MIAQISCPVFRCPKTSTSQCTGYRGTCDRYYCRTHAKGTLCDRCYTHKLEGMKAGYKGILKSLERKSYSASLTASVIALFTFSLLLLVLAIVFAYLQTNNRGLLPLFVILLGGAASGLGGTLIWYFMKAREYVRAESVELDLTHPGFYDYYRQWQDKMDEITSNTMSG